MVELDTKQKDGSWYKGSNFVWAINNNSLDKIGDESLHDSLAEGRDRHLDVSSDSVWGLMATHVSMGAVKFSFFNVHG